ncbi:M50 family metallopeptidase [Nocardia pseudobrasiliensis]|uniref:Peptidase M50B-like protein n=1 Tax=Nocardia pseudobrasiliensis TaxID=45979 RepID=A0A370HPM7_9NOCA|nr:M50 family metallopeptidase [Nocardia pseudobrasiliensis]RDI60417.1 peptidase M50B-like protein [Nocardia pseudobrasiliensis]
MSASEAVSSITDRLTEISQQPPMWVVLATAGAALVAVAYPPLWRILRTAVTIAHETGHAVVAVLTGRTLRGVRLHSDTSGVTVSRGKPYGLGMVLTTMAGYPAPSALGLGCAALLAAGRLTLMLWLVVAALAVLLVMIRNLFGLLAVVCAGAVVFVVSWYGTVVQQGVFGYAVAWFLLFGGLRTIAELQRVHMRGDGSDADQLAYLTRIPGLFWVLLFGAAALAALVFGGRLLLGFWPALGSA